MHTRYRAYISYSHADRRFATWLQRALEAYRVPRRLVTRGLPSRLAPIFRDQAELPSSANLRQTLRDALEQSDALIVVCSPEASASRWVNEEILHFKSLGRSERIFSVIARGDPPGCFPRALHVRFDAQGAPCHTDAEPVAPDARPGRDGRTDARLKLVAGLLGVGFDELKQRELHRRHNRMAIVTGLSLAVAAATLALALFALEAREDAERRRAQAEDLIGFMLGDLRRRLEPMGRLDLLNAVGDKSMAFFATLEADDLTPAVLLSRAIALRQIGEVRLAQGQVSEAQAAFEQSRALALRLSGQHPDNNNYLLELGQAHFWVGYVAFRRAQRADAAEHFHAYLRVAQQLTKRDGGNPDYLLEVAYAHSNLGTIDMLRNRTDSAAAHFQQAVAINQALLEQSPEDSDLQFDLAEGYSWLGAVDARLGKISGSIDWYRQEVAILEGLAARSDDTTFTLRLAVAHQLLGFQLRLAGRTAAARTHLDQSLALCERLVAHDPQNTRWRRTFYVAHLNLARAALQEGNPGAAQRHTAMSLDGLRGLEKLDPTHAGWQHDLAEGELMAADLAARKSDFELAMVNLDRAMDRVDRLLDSDGTDAAHLRLKASLLLAKGDALEQLGQPQQANGLWSRALQQVTSALPRIDDPTLLVTVLALAHRLGDHQREAELRARLRAMGYAGPMDAAAERAHGVPV